MYGLRRKFLIPLKKNNPDHPKLRTVYRRALYLPQSVSKMGWKDPLLQQTERNFTMGTIEKTLDIDTPAKQLFIPFTDPTGMRCSQKDTRMRLIGTQSLVTCTLIILLLSGLALLLGQTPRALARAQDRAD